MELGHPWGCHPGDSRAWHLCHIPWVYRKILGRSTRAIDRVGGGVSGMGTNILGAWGQVVRDRVARQFRTQGVTSVSTSIAQVLHGIHLHETFLLLI